MISKYLVCRVEELFCEMRQRADAQYQPFTLEIFTLRYVLKLERIFHCMCHCYFQQIVMLECCGRPFMANTFSLAKSGFVNKTFFTSLVVGLKTRLTLKRRTLQSLIESKRKFLSLNFKLHSFNFSGSGNV